METWTITVKGRVQGVGFRMFVRDAAEYLGINGEVWNRRDGAVQLNAQCGEPMLLEDLVARMSYGPGRVDEVTHQVIHPNIEYIGFRVSSTK